MYRKRDIRKLEEKRRESLQFRDRILEDVGKSLFERLDETALSGAGKEYRRFRQEITESEQSIHSIRDAVNQIKQLNEEISVKKQEQAERAEELEILLTALGKSLLGGTDLPPSLLPNKRQLDLCISRKNSIEDRLLDTENGQGGFFAWISGGVKTMILRSSLKKCGNLLERIYCRAGQKYLDEPEEENADAASAPLLRDARSFRRDSEELENTLRLLEAEKQKAETSLGFRGSPFRRIKALEQQAGKSREELRELYHKTGEDAAAGRQPVFAVLNGEDKARLEEAGRFQKSADEKAGEIEKIETAISIDRECRELARLEKALVNRKNRIADDEKAISELDRKVTETRDRIEKLRQKHNRSDDEN
jgi:methyl-accepting chemotaxis protein